MRLIEFAGQRFEAHPCGALYWPQQDLLIISDLHFEKASGYAASYKTFLPPYDTRETLLKLEEICGKIKPATLLFLGDVYHDIGSISRMAPEEKAGFEALLGTHEVIWIEGNHDPGYAPPGLTVLSETKIEAIVFRHMASYSDEPEISGHYHPAVTIHHKGQRIRKACFAVSCQKLIMPSFGVLTGRLDITDGALEKVLGRNPEVYITGQNKVYAL